MQFLRDGIQTVVYEIACVVLEVKVKTLQETRCTQK